MPGCSSTASSSAPVEVVADPSNPPLPTPDLHALHDTCTLRLLDNRRLLTVIGISLPSCHLQPPSTSRMSGTHATKDVDGPPLLGAAHLAFLGVRWLSTDIVKAVVGVHGGVKFYRGAARAARAYVERDRSRADDYYLAEGSGVATRLVATPDGVRSMGGMTGEVYEQWVAGIDLDTLTTKGHIRTDDNALRFVEVVVNGPKTWSLAAALYPEISAALDRAQDKAAIDIVSWIAAHATTRIGPRGRQVQVPSSPSRPRSSGTTRLAPATRTATCTCRSTPASGRPAPGGVSTPSGSGTASRRSTASATPPSRPTRSSGRCWLRTE